MSSSCVFCADQSHRSIFETDLIYAIWDAFPCTPGHILLIPKRHVPTWFDASLEEQIALMEGVNEAKTQIDLEHEPAGYNIGINSGAVAGQTVPHLHVHVIPRYFGDVADPRGGVRWVLPDKAVYWDK